TTLAASTRRLLPSATATTTGSALSLGSSRPSRSVANRGSQSEATRRAILSLHDPACGPATPAPHQFKPPARSREHARRRAGGAGQRGDAPAGDSGACPKILPPPPARRSQKKTDATGFGGKLQAAALG